MAKSKDKNDVAPVQVLPSDVVEDTLVQVIAEAVALLGKKKGKRLKAKWRLAGDTAETVLRQIAAAEGQDIAAIAAQSRIRLGAILRSLMDLQRCGLVEVSSGVARITPTGTAVLTALDQA